MRHSPATRTGLSELMATGHDALNGKRIGLITNHTAVDEQLRSIIDLLMQDDRFTLVSLFGPEHGVRGAAQAGDKVGTTTDPRTGLPVYSLYGNERAPTPAMLADIDVLLFDIQDAGSRFYTYAGTMIATMEVASAAGMDLVVLDRPNPITGLHPEGQVVETPFLSFVGMHPVAARHALTIGEYARLVARDRGWRPPVVIPMKGWTRDLWWDETGLPFVMPSPNLPTVTSTTAFPATCIVEGTNLSEGRGTTRPFETVGAPWIDAEAAANRLNARELPGVRFRPTWFVPTFSKHAGVTCGGVQMHIVDRNAFAPCATGIHVVHELRAMEPEQFSWLRNSVGNMSVARLYGNDRLSEMIDAGATAEEIITTWGPQLDEYRRSIDGILLYQDARA